MLKTLSSFLLFLGMTISALGALAQDAVLKVGDVAPDFSLQASDGKTYSLADFKGTKLDIDVKYFSSTAV